MPEWLSKITKSDIRNIIAIITVLGSFTLLFFMQFSAIPVNNKEVLNVAMGFILGAGCAGVYGYYFGSSKAENDARKNEQDDNSKP